MAIVDTPQFNIPAGTIDLSIGQPAMDLLPHALIKKAAEDFLSQKDISLLQYGIMQGDESFRQKLAQFLTEQYGTNVSAENLLITAGASQGLDLLCTLLSKAGDTILVEEPCYYLALHIFREHNLNIRTVPLDEEGIIIDELKRQLKTYNPVFVYCIPSFHNPAGITISKERREALVKSCEENSVYLIADEVYHLLSYKAPPPLPLICFSTKGCVYSLGSFSKIVSPGLRLGWIQSFSETTSKLSQCGLLASGGGFNPFIQGVLRSALQLGLLPDHLNLVRQNYYARSKVLYDYLIKYMPKTVSYNQAQGGFFMWLTFPAHYDTDKLLKIAENEQVRFHPGSRFSNRDTLNNCLRLSFCYYDQEDLAEGAKRLGKAIGNYTALV